VSLQGREERHTLPRGRRHALAPYGGAVLTLTGGQTVRAVIYIKSFPLREGLGRGFSVGGIHLAIKEKSLEMMIYNAVLELGGM